MSARYEITLCDTRVEITDPWGCVLTIYDGAHEMTAGAIRQQSADIAELSAVVALLTHKVICCGVAASHPNAALTTTGAYADKWDSPQAESVRKLRAERDQLRAELAAAVAERDRIKGDYGEAAHFARHFIRDDAAITPRGAIIRLGDKCTSLFARMKIAETERDEWIACHAQLYRKLGNLLAVIHRDGGHYESEHGTEKACEDAETAVHVMRGCVDGFISSANEWRQRAEQAEARLAAVDSAPVVARPKFIRGEICGCQTRPTHYVGEMDCPWHKRGDGQPKEAKD